MISFGKKWPNIKQISINWQDIPLYSKFSQLFNGESCQYLLRKKVTLLFFLIFLEFKNKVPLNWSEIARELKVFATQSTNIVTRQSLFNFSTFIDRFLCLISYLHRRPGIMFSVEYSHPRNIRIKIDIRIRKIAEKKMRMIEKKYR